jgi:lipid-A-disaccharide synthase
VQDAPIRVGMVAGEASGDLLGAQLITALQRRNPELRFAGIAGPRMQAQGAESYVPMEKVSVRGDAEVLGRSRALKGIRTRLIQRFLDDRPALYIGVDAPDFNLAVERRLHAAGVPTVQYVGPSVWAWRRWRVKQIARSVNHVLALFPFELPIYQQAGIPVTYVGHPLADSVPLDIDKAAARTQLRLPHGKLIVALLPGSRLAELRTMAETFVKAARRFTNEIKDVHFLVPASSRGNREFFEAALRLHAEDDLPLTVLFGHSHDALAAADLALVASGTASLEAVFFKTPMVIADRMATLRWWLSRRLRHLPYVGLPNILAGERFVPEFLQRQATPWALAGALMELMRDAQARRRQTERFHDIHLMLRQDHADKASEAVLGVLQGAAR